MGKSKIRIFFQGLNKGQKAVRRFLAVIFAGDIFKAETKAREAAMAMVVPDFATLIESAEKDGKSRVADADQRIADAQKLLAAAGADKAAGVARLKAIALLKPAK